MQDTPPAVEAHQSIERPSMVLYYFPECPFCHKVLETLKTLNVNVELRNTRENPEYKNFLKETVGKTQVPCLFVNDQPMHESMDIIRYLRSIS